MQLSSRILTALAVLILAVAVVAVRGGGGSDTVEAATGTIDVLNVGTCYTTDTDVFDVGDCDGWHNNSAIDGSNGITETGTVYATYAYDPKTAADNPRGVLANSNLIKISIEDTGRDKRTNVLYRAGAEVTGFAPPDVIGMIREDLGDDELDIVHNYSWALRGDTDVNADNPVISDDSNITDAISDKIINGITLNKAGQTCDADGNPGTGNVDNCHFRPMYTVEGNDSPITLFGFYDDDGGAAGCAIGTVGTHGDTCGFRKLNQYLKIDEDVGSGTGEEETSGANPAPEVAPWFSVRVSLPAGSSATLLYVVYETSEYEELVGGQDDADYGTAEPPAFTKSEDSGNTDLVVSARSDGRTTSQNLWLKETGRFDWSIRGLPNVDR